MARIVALDNFLDEELKKFELPSTIKRPCKTEYILDERFDECSYHFERYWKIKSLTAQQHEDIKRKAGEGAEYHLAKLSIQSAKMFVGPLTINGRSVQDGNFAYYRQSDIDWYVFS